MPYRKKGRKIKNNDNNILSIIYRSKIPQNLFLNDDLLQVPSKTFQLQDLDIFMVYRKVAIDIINNFGAFNFKYGFRDESKCSNTHFLRDAVCYEDEDEE